MPSDLPPDITVERATKMPYDEFASLYPEINTTRGDTQ